LIHNILKHIRTYHINFISFCLLELWDANMFLGFNDRFPGYPQEEVKEVISG
jgi:hypothetical protein